jgi:DNA-binding MarR family transcriptional regulator
MLSIQPVQMEAGGAKLDQEMMEAVSKVGRVFVSDIYAYYQDTYKGVLGKVQVEALDYLHLTAGSGITQLAARLNISKQHASKIAAKLEELGYAEKKPDPRDRRACLYVLSPSGIQFVQSHISMSNQYMEEYVSSLSASDYALLRASLLQAAQILETCSPRSACSPDITGP